MSPLQLPARDELGSMSLDALNGLVDRIDTALDEIHEAPDGSPRDLSDEEQTRFDDMLSFRDDARRARLRTYVDAGAFEPGDGAAPLDGSDRSRTGDSAALRTIGDLHTRGALDDAASEASEELVRTTLPDSWGRNPAAEWIKVAGDDAYRRAFAKLIQDPVRGHLEWTRAEHEAYQRTQLTTRALSLTDTAGGHLVPLTLDPAIHLTSAGSISPIKRIARNVTTVTDTWKGITSAGTSAEWKAEAAEVADGAFTVAGPEIAVNLYDVFVSFSIEVSMDASDFEREVRRVMLDAVDQLHATAWINGSGSGQPTGIITALDGGSSEVAPGTAEAFTASTDVYLVGEALRPRSKAKAQWVAADSTINAIAQAETTNGARLFPGVETANPTLLRRPLHEDSTMDQASAINPAATATNHVLLYGDFDEYVIVNRVGTTVELVPHLFATANNRPSGQRGFFMYGRVGADSLVDEAFAVLDVATTA